MRTVALQPWDCDWKTMTKNHPFNGQSSGQCTCLAILCYRKWPENKIYMDLRVTTLAWPPRRGRPCIFLGVCLCPSLISSFFLFFRIVLGAYKVSLFTQTSIHACFVPSIILVLWGILKWNRSHHFPCFSPPPHICRIFLTYMHSKCSTCAWSPLILRKTPKRSLVLLDDTAQMLN